MNSELILVCLFYIIKLLTTELQCTTKIHHTLFHLHYVKIVSYVGLKNRLTGGACISEENILPFSDTHVTHLIHCQHCKSHRQPFLFNKVILLFQYSCTFCGDGTCYFMQQSTELCIKIDHCVSRKQMCKFSIAKPLQLQYRHNNTCFQ